MNDSPASRLSAWLPFVSLAITLAAFCSGAPAKLTHFRAARPVVTENDFRDEPAMYPPHPDLYSWRGLNALSARTAIALR